MGNLLYEEAKKVARQEQCRSFALYPKKYFYSEIRTSEQFSIIQKESDDNKDTKANVMRHSPNRRNILEDKKQTSFSSFVSLPTSSQRSSSSDKLLLPFQRLRSSSLLTPISQRNTEGHRRQRAVTLGDFSRVHGSGSLLKPDKIRQRGHPAAREGIERALRFCRRRWTESRIVRPGGRVDKAAEGRTRGERERDRVCV